MKGIFYGVGTGPGDPELMTLKAVRLIKENNIVAVPCKEPSASAAYRTAVQAVPELSDKALLPIVMPMTNDEEILPHAHKKAAEDIEQYLSSGDNVVYITLGDPNLYSSYSYLRDIICHDGYIAETVSGITSLSACASKLGISLAQRNEPLHVYTSFEDITDPRGNIAVMKSGKTGNNIPKILENKKIYAAENCGMENERLYTDTVPEHMGYFTTFILKDDK